MKGKTFLRPPPPIAVLCLLALLGSGCGAPRLSLFPGTTDPLREFTLEGTEGGKVLLVHVRGSISDRGKKGVFGRQPGMLQGVVSQLRKAEKDREIKALLLQIDSPGGTVAASDILYHEIATFKKRTGAAVVAILMKTATSGAYYLALPADYIMAHPTTVTGSAGVIFLRPKVTGLIGKLGLSMEVTKSGELKDMGSPFRRETEEEAQILQGIIDEFSDRFLELISFHRRLEEEALHEVATARIFLASEAKSLGLTDGTGYLDDAFAKARELAGLSDRAKVVVYRRRKHPDDTPYHAIASRDGTGPSSLIDLPLPEVLGAMESGFYYLWLPGLGGD